jgi:O-antigen ligase
MGLAALASLLVTPILSASLIWVAFVLVGVVFVLAMAGGRPRRWAAWLTPLRVTRLFLLLGYLLLAMALLATRWPAYKWSWLEPLFAALPSVRSLPVSWLAQGIQPNQTGGVLATAVAFALALCVAGPRGLAGRGVRGWTLHATRFLAVAGTIVVFMTGSRAALAGEGVALVFALMLRGRRWLWLPGGVIGAVVVIALLWPHALQALVGLLLHDETVDTKVIARLDIWGSALRGIVDHPFSGIGLGVFNEVIPTRYPYQTVGLSYSVSQAHNVFLDTALGIGLPGLAGLLLLLGGMVLLAARDIATIRSSTYVLTGLTASAIVFVIFGITDSLSLSTPSSLLLWLWVGSAALVAGHVTNRD